MQGRGPGFKSRWVHCFIFMIFFGVCNFFLINIFSLFVQHLFCGGIVCEGVVIFFVIIRALVTLLALTNRILVFVRLICGKDFFVFF